MEQFLETTNDIKRVAPCRCLDGHIKEPDRRFNFFFSPPGHLCAVTYITEISLHATLSNQYRLISSQLAENKWSL